jgi:hypothetical protein
LVQTQANDNHIPFRNDEHIVVIISAG